GTRLRFFSTTTALVRPPAKLWRTVSVSRFSESGLRPLLPTRIVLSLLVVSLIHHVLRLFAFGRHAVADALVALEAERRLQKTSACRALKHGSMYHISPAHCQTQFRRRELADDRHTRGISKSATERL